MDWPQLLVLVGLAVTVIGWGLTLIGLLCLR
jgi:hypothetical protein